MKLDKANHKAFLYQLVSLKDGQARQYPLEKLDVAISVAKKLAEGTKQKDTTMEFTPGEVTFTAEEWVFLKERLNEVKEASLEQGVVINELKELFKG